MSSYHEVYQKDKEEIEPIQKRLDQEEKELQGQISILENAINQESGKLENLETIINSLDNYFTSNYQNFSEELISKKNELNKYESKLSRLKKSSDIYQDFKRKSENDHNCPLYERPFNDTEFHSFLEK
jgi:DNA repair exonuclease SbcCD ATPase subunit